jgi:hypothetical protein
MPTHLPTPDADRRLEELERRMAALEAAVRARKPAIGTAGRQPCRPRLVKWGKRR